MIILAGGRHPAFRMTRCSICLIVQLRCQNGRMVLNTELIDLLELNRRLAIWEKAEEFHNDTNSVSNLQINYL